MATEEFETGPSRLRGGGGGNSMIGGGSDDDGMEPTTGLWIPEERGDAIAITLGGTFIHSLPMVTRCEEPRRCDAVRDRSNCLST
ncbi:unnamed protein product [Gongylonema pulchrum]|uniref:BTB/POZ domain-containing protein n=1 Tax=Gongylonema pulchrum TaxID=637853 RepID=A0A183EKI5_9BILA|nr:unnamed protein product [Gongylonema pulchrum]